MKGDRILITATNKKLGLINGDLGEVLHASTEKFIVSIPTSKKTIEFNPKEYDGFKHGYATTVFKAQGASIKDVYVFHDQFSGIRNSYVSLSRHIDELKLYTNRESTIDTKVLVKQLNRDFDKGSSLQYLTEEEIGYRDDVESAKKTITGKFLVRVLNVLEKVTDKYIPKSEYYSYKEPVKASSTVEKVIDNFVLEEEVAGFSLENKIAVGENAGNRISNTLGVAAATSKPRTAAKEGFYANTDSVQNQRNKADLKAQWDKEAEELKAHLKFKSEIVARDLLGEPNKRLSNGRELRYGEHGKIVVRISGDKAGMWHDFSESKGGDLFSLVTHVRGGEFKEAAEYLRGVVGMKSTTSLRLVHDHNSRDQYASHQKVKRLEERIEKQKIKATSDLLVRAKEINHKNVAYRYLREQRNISCELGGDIKTTGIYEREAGKSFPALIAFARDEHGNVTGGQRLLLDSKTYGKAKVDVPKKSFGHISGSFVEVAKPEKPNIIIIAEGLETALSVKQALSEHSQETDEIKNVRILCSLGVSNIKNYAPKKGEKIIIAADNDGPDSITGKTVLNAKVLLEEKGAFVEVVKPDRKGDFNDLLKAEESKLINSLFTPAITSHSAKTLEEYVKAQAETKPIALDENDKANLAYILGKGINQEEIINAWRTSELKGKIELDETRKKVSVAEHNLAANSSILEIAGKYKAEINKSALFEDLVHNFSKTPEEACISHVLEQFAKEKLEAGKIGEVYNIIKREEGFLSELKVGEKAQLSDNLRERIDLSQNGESKKVLGSLKENLEANYKQGIIPYGELKNMLISFGPDIKGMDVHLNKLANENRAKELYLIRAEVSELDKLGYKYDKNELVGAIKSMSYQQKIEYGNKLLLEYTKNYLTPILARHNEEKERATNYHEFMKAIEREQNTLVKLHNDNRFGIQALDEYNKGKSKLTALANGASVIQSLGGIKKVLGTIDYAVKHNITDRETVVTDLRRNGGNLEYTHDILSRKCESHKAEMYINRSISNTNRINKEQEKNNEIKIDRGRGMSL